MRSHYLFYFLFFMHFILRVFLLTASPSLLSSSRPSLHHRSHKPSRRPFSPSPISQVQPPHTLLSIADLTSPATIDPSVSQVSSVGTKTDRASGTGRGCPPVCVGIEVEIGVRWQWLCRVLWYRVEIGFAPVCVGIEFVLCCCVGGGCAVDRKSVV